MELYSVLLETPTPAEPAGGDVTAEAIERGWILPFAAGQFIYGPPWTALVRRFQSLLLDRAAAMGFAEFTFPRMLSADTVGDFKLSQFKPELLWRLADSDLVLDPVQCLPLYETLRGRRLDPDDLPLRVVESMGGWSWRREQPQDLDGVFRTVEFARVEHVWLGSPEQARQIRDQVRLSVTELIMELGLAVQHSVGEGCMAIASVEERRAAARTAEEVPVIDIALLVRPPARPGAATSEDFDEIAGCTVEGDHHLASFGVSRADGGPLWSGCCGVGLNRLATGFLFQHGFDPAGWPDLVRTGFPGGAITGALRRTTDTTRAATG